MDMHFTDGDLEIETFQCTWKIDKFSKYTDRDEIYSPPFKIHDGRTHSQWIMLLYPYGISKTEDYVSLYIKIVDTNALSLKEYAFRLSILDNDGIEQFQHHSSDVKQLNFLKRGWPQFCKRDTILNLTNILLKNDILKVFCCVNLNPYSKEELLKENTLINNYRCLLSIPSFSDLTIVIGAKEIKAHKNILSVRSKVFSAMLQHDMIEQNTSTIVIDDISYEVMIELLQFLYCGKVQNIDKLAKPLLIAADKYDISSLKMICERTLFENLQEENACEIFVVADRFNCIKLKSKTIDFIINNIKAITPTSKFKELKISNAELLEEIICRMAEGIK